MMQSTRLAHHSLRTADLLVLASILLPLYIWLFPCMTLVDELSIHFGCATFERTHHHGQDAFQPSGALESGLGFGSVVIIAITVIGQLGVFALVSRWCA